MPTKEEPSYPFPSRSRLIVGAELYDGTGQPPVVRDVAVRDGRIAASGNLSNWLAEEVVEAEGRALAPGLIDVHTHDDTHVIRQPQMLPKITQTQLNDIANLHKGGPRQALGWLTPEKAMANEEKAGSGNLALDS